MEWLVNTSLDRCLSLCASQDLSSTDDEPAMVRTVPAGIGAPSVLPAPGERFAIFNVFSGRCLFDDHSIHPGGVAVLFLSSPESDDKEYTQTGRLFELLLPGADDCCPAAWRIRNSSTGRLVHGGSQKLSVSPEPSSPDQYWDIIPSSKWPGTFRIVNRATGICAFDSFGDPSARTVEWFARVSAGNLYHDNRHWLFIAEGQTPEDCVKWQPLLRDLPMMRDFEVGAGLRFSNDLSLVG